jgi:hypothetical protein
VGGRDDAYLVRDIGPRVFLRHGEESGDLASVGRQGCCADFRRVSFGDAVEDQAETVACVLVHFLAAI